MLSEKTQEAAKTPVPTEANIKIVVLVTVCVFLSAITFAVYHTREVVFNIGCSSRMHQLAFMIKEYKPGNGHFPPPVTYNEEGKAMHSWRTIVLRDFFPEYVNGYDFSLPWDSPENLEFARNNVPDMVKYPDDARGTAANYMLAIGEGCLYPSRNSKPEILSPTDSNEPVLILVESARDDVLWTEPVDVEGVTEANPFVRPKYLGKHRKRARVLYYDPKAGFRSGTEGEAYQTEEDLR